MKPTKLSPAQLKLKAVLKPIVESILREGHKYKLKESKSKFTEFYINVDIDERGEYGATVYDPHDNEIWSARTEEVAELIEDGYLKYKPHNDLRRLRDYLASHNIIPKNAAIYDERDWEDRSEGY